MPQCKIRLLSLAVIERLSTWALPDVNLGYTDKRERLDLYFSSFCLATKRSRVYHAAMEGKRTHPREYSLDWGKCGLGHFFLTLEQSDWEDSTQRAHCLKRTASKNTVVFSAPLCSMDSTYKESLTVGKPWIKPKEPQNCVQLSSACLFTIRHLLSGGLTVAKVYFTVSSNA